VEKIAGMHVEPDYGNVPGCTYATPEIASVGLTEKQAKKRKDTGGGKFLSQHQEKQKLLEHQTVCKSNF
jgi:pyruvate/2-oxoglutarate dehydrogenase complex dihydrolipoamide dehydrogenase (E3) component